MKQFFKFFFACLLAIIVSGILLGVVFFGIMGALVSSATSQQTTVIKEKSILEIDLKKAISEIPQTNILSAITGNSNGASVGLYEVIKSIESSKTDDNIKGIFIKAGGNANAWATSQQLRFALEDFKKSGKFIYAYADGISQKSYFVTSVADSIFLNPLGSVEFLGLSTNIMFYKGLLDKLEVEPEIFYCGKFKSATEPMRAYKMTPENRTQIAAYQADFWAEVLAATAQHTKLSTLTLDSLAKNGAVQNSDDALKYKFVDGIWYQDQFDSLLKVKTGMEPNQKLNFASLSDYKTRLSQKPSSNQIALLIAEGNIVDGSAGATSDAVIASDDFIAEIRKIRDNNSIKAVVLRINSPGGSALASENILRELNILKKTKKLVVSMGDYAASGGYYMACNADSVFALPTTITGSIGVFGIMMNLEKMYNNKLGITFDSEKTGPYADLGNNSRKMNDVEKGMIQKGVDTIYSIFKSRVAEGRGLDTAYVDSVGQGRVWTGTQALRLKLVDGLGDLNRAISAAANLAGLTDYRVYTYPKQVSDMDRLLKLMNSSQAGNTQIAQNFLANELGLSFNGWKQLQLMVKYPKTNWTLMPFIPETN